MHNFGRGNSCHGVVEIVEGLMLPQWSLNNQLLFIMPLGVQVLTQWSNCSCHRVMWYWKYNWKLRWARRKETFWKFEINAFCQILHTCGFSCTWKYKAVILEILPLLNCNSVICENYHYYRLLTLNLGAS